MTSTIDTRTVQPTATPAVTRKSSLRRRLLTSLGVGLAAALLLFSLAGVWFVYNAEQNAWQARQTNATQTVAAAAEQLLTRNQRTLALFASLDTAYIEDDAAVMQYWLSQNPAFVELLRFDAAGEMIAGAAQATSLRFNATTVVVEEWFVAATNGAPFVSDVQFSADKTPTIILSHPTEDGGVAAARIELESLVAALEGVRVGSSDTAYIVAPDGRLLVHPNKKLVTDAVTLAMRPEFDLMQSAESTWRGSYENLYSQAVVGQSAKMASTGWFVISELDQRELQQQNRLAALVAGGGSLLLLGGLLWALRRLLDGLVFGRINNLRSQVEQLGQGQYLTPNTQEDPDELGDLAQAVTQLSTVVKQRDERLAAQTVTLEQQSAEREVALENSQRVSAQLRKSGQFQDQFLSTMSHELRTPLNAILGMAEAMTVPVYGNLNPQQAQAMDHIRESGTQLLTLIDDILDLSKLSAGKVLIEINPVWIEAVVQACLRHIQPLSAEKGLHVETKIDPNVTAIMADEQRLRQMIINLLDNAVKFTPKGGTIGLVIKGHAAEGKLDLIVHDTGIGISEKAMDQLFEPFAQLDAGLARQYGGTGLGLALVHKLVDLHGGSVSVKSEVNVGSQFCMTLPWIEPPQLVEERVLDAEVGDSAESLIQSNATGASILLAEDREANIVILRDYLQSHGYRVRVARNGLQAVEMTRLHHPQLILMDIQMPEMNGLEATRLIRADKKTEDIPIIALTALAMPGDREKCLQVGANEYVSKPVSLRQIVELIETQLKK